MTEIKSKLASAHHARFGDAIWYDPQFVDYIIIGGAGGIGSWLSALLSRAGYQLVIYDDDTIDETNFAGQLYMVDHLNVNKATAIADMCKKLGATQDIITLGRFNKRTRVNPVVFSAFDNMAARKLLFETWVDDYGDFKTPSLFVDGRMLAEAGQIFFVQSPEDIKLYRETLFDDKEVKEQPCSMKATSHCGAFISSMMVTGFTNWVSNQKLKDDIREVPFRLEFELPLYGLTTKSTQQCMKQSPTVSTVISVTD